MDIKYYAEILLNSGKLPEDCPFNKTDVIICMQDLLDDDPWLDEPWTEEELKVLKDL